MKETLSKDQVRLAYAKKQCGRYFSRLSDEVIDNIFAFIGVSEWPKLIRINYFFRNRIHNLPVTTNDKNEKLTYITLLTEFNTAKEKSSKLGSQRCDMQNKMYSLMKDIEFTCFTLLSIDAGLLTGFVFYRVFDSYFLGIEHTVLVGLASWITTLLTYKDSDTSYELCTMFAKKVADYKLQESETEIEAQISHLQSVLCFKK